MGSHAGCSVIPGGIGRIPPYIFTWELPIWKIWQLEMAHFRNEKLCFQGKILQQIEIRSWSNGVCCSHCISFRWHFWHIYFISNHFIIKNKVLSYHGWNSEKRSTVANYLYFPSNKNKHTFVSLFILRIFRDISNFWKASQPLSKPITTHWILSHHVKLKVAIIKFPHLFIFLWFLLPLFAN